MCVYFVFLFFTKLFSLFIFFVQSFGLIVLFDFLKCLLNERNTGKKYNNKKVK